MKCYEAPNAYAPDGSPSILLAGGITGVRPGLPVFDSPTDTVQAAREALGQVG
jgi:hypothetical protein